MLSFELTMPNVGSWNGKWTGADKRYYKMRRASRKTETDLDGRRFYYDFGDGWGASINIDKIDAKEAARRRRKSAGFCGYEWMINEILDYGRILTLHERREG